MNIQTKLLLVIGISLFFIFVVVELANYQYVKREIEISLQDQAEKVRSLLMAYRHTQQVAFVENSISLNNKTINFLPAYTISKISANYPNWDNSGFSFNNVSDQPRNPDNTADKIELEAMDYFRANPNEELLFKPFTNNTGEQYYLYARPIWVEELCLKCHAKREDAPETIRELYDTAWNYKVGDLRGILSVKLPTSTITKRVWSVYKQNLIIQLFGFIAIFILVSIVIRRNVTRPLSNLANSIQTFAYQDHTHRATKFEGEFGIVSQAFNNMACEITTQQEILHNEVAAREQEQKFLQHIMDSLNHPFYVINANNYQVELANAFMYRLGFQPKITCYKLLFCREQPCSYDDKFCPLTEMKTTKQPITFEDIHFDKNINKYVEIHCFPIFDSQGNVVKMIEYYLDITKRKANEEALRNSEKNLSIALKKAEQANQAKSQFLANMSHELRTPMIGIMGYTDLLSDEENLTEDQEYYLQSIATSSQNLLGIINDILDASAIEAKKMGIKAIAFQLDELLDNVFDLFHKKAENKGLKLQFVADDDIPNTLIGDPLRIRQVLISLVNNAIKFTQQGKITVYTKVNKLEPVILCFSIQDTGLGISPKAIPYLFDTFTQADNSYTREFGGTGLGLAICKYLIDMMGGNIWVESEPGKGSTFYFNLELQNC